MSTTFFLSSEKVGYLLFLVYKMFSFHSVISSIRKSIEKLALPMAPRKGHRMIAFNLMYFSLSPTKHFKSTKEEECGGRIRGGGWSHLPDPRAGERISNPGSAWGRERGAERACAKGIPSGTTGRVRMSVSAGLGRL